MTEVAATAAPVNDDAIDSDVKENGDTKMEEANDENKPANEDNTITADEVSVPIPESAHEEQSKSNRKKGLDEAKRYNQRNRNHNDKHSRPQREKHDRFSFDKNRGSHRQNIKFDPASLPDSDDPEAIRKQVEFYFSTSNLLTDKFLFTKMEGHKNIPVPIDVIYSFKRMQRFKPREAVISALKDSNLLSVVNEDNDVQRREPIAEDLTGKSMEEVQKVHEDQSMARSVYAKGFGEEEASTQFDIEAFFSNYGTTNSVRLRRQTDGVFKQSVFVEFDGEELATNFLAIDPPPKYKDQELKVMSKKEYCDEKVEAINDGRIRRRSPDDGRRSGFDERRRNHEHRDLGRHDDRDWRLRRQDDAAEGFPERRNKGSRHENKRGRGHRGFGSSGRGRGGRGRDRDRDGERENHEKRSASKDSKEDTQANAGSKDTDVSNAPTSEDSNMHAETPASLKKRPRDENDGAEDDNEVAAEVPSSKRAREDIEAEVRKEPEVLDAGLVASKKRSREDDDIGIGNEPKRVDVKEG